MILRVDENKVTDFISNAKDFLDYSTGKVTDKDLLKDLVDAEDREIESFPELNDFIKEFKGDKNRYQVMVDNKGKGNNFIVSFSAKSVPTDLADKVKPDGEYFKNILSYDKNSKEVEMIFTKKNNESVMAPTPTPYEMELNVNSDEEDLNESKNPFKDHHICQGCGKPLSQCTCEIKEEDFSEDESQTYSVVRVGGSIGEKRSFVVKSGLSKEEAQEYAKVRMKSLSPGEKKYYGIKYKVVPDEEVDESLTEGKDSVSKDDHDDIIFRLRKLSTEASEALHKYESLGNLEECRDILYYLVNDSRRLLDFVNDLLVSRKSESLEEDVSEAPSYEAVGVKEMPDGTYELQCIDHSYNDEEFTKYIGRPGTPTAKKNASLFFRDKTLYFKDKELEDHIKSMFLEECTQPSNIGQYKVDDKLDMFN